MRKKNRWLETTVLIAVLLSAAIGLAVLYQANTGKAFYKGEPAVIVKKMATTESCCCKNSATGHPYEIYAGMDSEASPLAKKAACAEKCGDSKALYSSAGKCGLNLLTPITV